MKRTPLQRRTPIRAKAPIARKTQIRRTRMKRARPPVRNKSHRDFIRQLPCVVCLCGPAECAHVRFSSAAHGKVNPGMANKHDEWCVPLCAQCHRVGPAAQHGTGAEEAWWIRQGIDVLSIARALFACSTDIEAGERIIRRMR